ncbi:MAG: MFS transporter [Acidimicrobiia bacterium]
MSETTTDADVAGAATEPDPRRWLVLAAVAMAALIVTIDNGVLTVAVPTVMKDFDATLNSVQWVITGYSLVFATFLIIGGRLGDIHGHRTTFAIGAALFAFGSLLATLSWSVPSLFVGEALIEGLGASLMLPATLAVISTTFQGHERATAFGLWATVVGVGAALGPVLGGFFTSELTWRWAFAINVVVAPVSALGVLLFLRAAPKPERRPRLDFTGAALIASGMFLFVLGISEGGRYGWWKPLEAVSVNGTDVWPASAPVSPVPVAFALAVVLLATFVVVERRKERAGRDPLFEFGQLRHRGFRYGLLTNLLLAMGQLVMMLLLVVFLQASNHLTAEETGLWLLPLGVGIAIGARIGTWCAHRIGPTHTVRIGLTAQVFAFVEMAIVITPGVTFLALCLGMSAFGIGLGMASSQLTNVVLSDVDEDKTGVASGSNTTVRQVGGALGIAIVGTILTVQTIHHTSSEIRAARLPAAVQAQAVADVRAAGTNFVPSARVTARESAVLEDAFVQGVADASQVALVFATVAVVIGLGLSFLIPVIAATPKPRDEEERTIELLESLEMMEPIEPSRDVVRGREPGTLH